MRTVLIKTIENLYFLSYINSDVILPSLNQPKHMPAGITRRMSAFSSLK